jgi:7-carboxy-7-deazaguanine synthase
MAGLRVLEVFDSLQGEGYWTGTPMTFVRLAGCNAPGLGLGCTRWCDTRDSWDPEGGEALPIDEIVRRGGLPRLCLTGGEPLLQVEGVTELLAEAHRRGIRVHLETNGTVDPPSDARAGFDWVTLSPKPPGYAISRGWTGRVDELKLVVDEALDAATAERVAATHPEAVISIQPRYSVGRVGAHTAGAHPDQASAELAVALVMGHPEWRLSLQLHKSLGIR